MSPEPYSQPAPISIERIEAHLQASINAQDRLTELYIQASEEAADAEATFKESFAKSRWTARINSVVDGVKITESAADDIASQHTAESRRQMLKTDAKRDGLRQALLSERAKQDSLRSLNTNHRTMGA